MKAHFAEGGGRDKAFTLIEVVTTSAVFSMVILAMVSTQIFGLKQDALAQSKLGSSDASRKGFGLLARDVRTSKTWQVGNIASTNFTPISSGSLQQGSAINLCVTDDTNKWIQYYFIATNGFNGALYRKRWDQTQSCIATNLTGTLYFQAEDYNGNPSSTATYKNVIHVILQFAQYQYPTVTVGIGNYYDYYKMEFRLTPHIPD